MNKFGDERKRTLADELSGKQAGDTGFICENIHPVMLGVTYWDCFAPWQVPERRICDNFILVVKEGRVTVAVNGEERILAAGEWCTVPEFVPHSFGLAPGCCKCSHFICHCLFCGGGRINPFSCFRSPFHRFLYPESEFSMLTLIVAMRNYDHNNAMRIARWKVLEWFIQEAGKENFEQHPVLPGDIRILKAVEFIENNFRSNIGVADIAASASLGVVRLRTLFQQATGMSPGAYLLRFRLLFAARRLARYDVSVAEIAAESGFSSPAYFSSAFRHAFNCSPCEFRNFIRKI